MRRGLVLAVLLAVADARLLSAPPPPPLLGVQAVRHDFHEWLPLLIGALVLLSCCFAVAQHGQLMLALCVLKALVALVCCCIPGAKAWAEARTGERPSLAADESTPLTTTPLKKL